MAVLKAPDALIQAARSSGGPLAILVYGPDAGRVHDLVQQLIRTHAGKSGDPLGLVQIEDAELAKDPARLADEAGSLSFFGGRRTILVSGANFGFLKAVQALPSKAQPDTLIVAEGSAFPKAHKLRSLFEAAGHLATVACYEDSPEELRRLALTTLKEQGFSIADDALEMLCVNLGADRLLSRQELEKLMTYCGEHRNISSTDVKAICGDVSPSGLDELLDAAFEGAVAELGALYTRLIDEGEDPGRLLSAAANHLALLQKQKAGGGQTSNYLPFQRQASVQRQLRLWQVDGLLEAGSGLARAVSNCRQRADLAQSIADRALLALAWAAKAQSSAASRS